VTRPPAPRKRGQGHGRWLPRRAREGEVPPAPSVAREPRAARRMWPSASSYGVGTPKWFMYFAAHYPARAFPCQRFTGTVALADA
jgi:hypothetical protein